jgi:hypothetical protein
VERAVMERAELHHPLVAHLAPQSPGLGVAQVVGMAGTAAVSNQFFTCNTGGVHT